MRCSRWFRALECGAFCRFSVVHHTFKQIAGLLARRIVFNYAEGDIVERGQRVGLIKFGSRVDVLLPAEAVLRVKVGERVKGGSNVLAEMPVMEAASATR